MSEKLRIKELVKTFGDKHILKELSFDVYTGEFLSILGPSGCGKTTLLRILCGLLEPTAGLVFKDGADITRLSPSRRGMGIVFQSYALFQNMTALENVEYALHFQKDKKARARKIASDLISLLGLEDHSHKKPHKLSGGQQQRVAIARTLALNPEIILFDEPLSALDVENRLALRTVLKDLQERFHSTMIYITHDQEEAFALSDRIMVLNAGAIQQLDTPESILSTPANAFIEDFVVRNLQLKMDSLLKYSRRETAGTTCGADRMAGGL